MSALRLGLSAITKTVYAGRLNKKGDCWTTKTDVNDDFMKCVIERFVDDETIVKFEGGAQYEIRVTKLENWK
jgi:hypothetical protein